VIEFEEFDISLP